MNTTLGNNMYTIQVFKTYSKSNKTKLTFRFYKFPDVIYLSNKL